MTGRWIHAVGLAATLAGLIVLAAVGLDRWNAARHTRVRIARDFGAAAAVRPRTVWFEEEYFTWTGEGFAMRAVELPIDVADPVAGVCPPGFAVDSIPDWIVEMTELDRYVSLGLPFCLRSKPAGSGYKMALVRGRTVVYVSE